MVQEDIRLKLSLFKTAVSLANITAKIGFLSVCLIIGVIPSGFSIKFSIQTGLPEEESKDVESSINQLLLKTSKSLLCLTKSAEESKETLLTQKIQDIFSQIDDKEDVLDQVTAKFKRILIARTKIHSRKLKKILNGIPNRSILDLDTQVEKFSAKFQFQENTVIDSSPQINSPDWFDLDQFPQLPTPSRRPDWTTELIDSPAPAHSTWPASPGSDQMCPSAIHPSSPFSPPSPSPSSPGFPSTTRPPSGASGQGCPTSPSNSLPQSIPPPSSNPKEDSSNPKPSHISTSPITVIPYSTDNFKPLVLHDANVSNSIISLLSKGPTFSPTPLDPPDLSSLEEDILDWRERIRWAYLFRNNRLKDDPNVDLSISPPFIKPPWYSRTDKIAPTASEEVELFMAMVRKSWLSPDIFSKYSSNISSLESKAFKELRNLKADGFSVFLQDKSSRFVIAKRELIEEKVDEDLNDSTKYIKLNEDDLDSILHQIQSWWSRNKSCLAVEDDISAWLVNPNSKPGKMKVLLKTHKPNLPVREVFSVCNQPVEHLSAFIQHCYLGQLSTLVFSNGD